MEECPHSTIEASLNRWEECHWHLHLMEQNYHEPEPFRYAFNSFLRAVKEVPSIIDHDSQVSPAPVKATIKRSLENLRRSALFTVLGKHRNFIVHRGTLEACFRHLTLHNASI
jgi:hypothetical protein